MKELIVSVCLGVAMATPALGETAHTWYGVLLGQHGATCQVIKNDSPAKAYKDLQNGGFQAQIIDKGGEVIVRGSNKGTTFTTSFFRTEKACEEAAAAQLRRDDATASR
jgi:hypothetical protein